MKCITKGCINEALEGSNYCEDHKPSPRIPSKPGVRGYSKGSRVVMKKAAKKAAKKVAKKAVSKKVAKRR